MTGGVIGNELDESGRLVRRKGGYLCKGIRREVQHAYYLWPQSASVHVEEYRANYVTLRYMLLFAVSTPIVPFLVGNLQRNVFMKATYRVMQLLFFILLRTFVVCYCPGGFNTRGKSIRHSEIAKKKTKTISKNDRCIYQEALERRYSWCEKWLT